MVDEVMRNAIRSSMTCDMCGELKLGNGKVTDDGYFTVKYHTYHFCPDCSKKIDDMCVNKKILPKRWSEQ